MDKKPDEFYELRAEIEKAAFVKGEIKYDPIEKDIEDMANHHLTFTKRKYEGGQTLKFFKQIKLFDISRKSFYRKPIKEDLDTDDIKSITILNHHVHSFLLNFSEEIWRLNHDTRREAGEEAIKELKQGHLEATKRALEKLGYSEGGISRAIQVLGDDKKLRKALKKFKSTRDYRYFVKTNSKGHDWIKRETDTIARIRGFYLNAFNDEIHGEGLSLDPLSEREIVSSMVIVFHKIEFWPNSEIGTIYDKIRKRLQRADKHRVEITLFDPSS